MILFLLQRGSRGEGAAAPFPRTPNPRRATSASLRTISLQDSEHLFQGHHVSVALLRRVRGNGLKTQNTPARRLGRNSRILTGAGSVPGLLFVNSPR